MTREHEALRDYVDGRFDRGTAETLHHLIDAALAAEKPAAEETPAVVRKPR